jgi:hypothetical protein
VIKLVDRHRPRLAAVNPTRQGRGRLCGWLVVALLFMQMAVAAYACPRGMAGDAGTAMAAMPDCAGASAMAMDPDQPQLCKVHCDQGTQAVNPMPIGDVFTAAPMLLAVLDWSGGTLLRTPPETQRASLPTGAPPPGSPPLFISLLVLRN